MNKLLLNILGGLLFCIIMTIFGLFATLLFFTFKDLFMILFSLILFYSIGEEIIHFIQK